MPAKKPLGPRFRAKLERRSNGCLEWAGAIPDGLFVCHRCDNKLCCDTEHMFLGTPKENTHDAIRKGRWGGPDDLRPKFLGIDCAPLGSTSGCQVLMEQSRALTNNRHDHS